MPASDFDAHFPRRSPDKDGLTVSCAIHVDGKYLTQRRPDGPKADPVRGSHAAVSLRNLQPDGACDASGTDGGALAAATLLGRHRLDDQICAVRGIHRRCGKSERNLHQSADVGPVEIVG